MSSTTTKTVKETLFHTLSSKDTLEHLNSNPNGLSENEASERLGRFGKNELQEGKKRTLIGMFLSQFKDVMVIILLIAAVIAGLTHELTDSIIILFVVIINAVLGVVQESKAEKALAALKKMSSPFAKVKRNGEVKLIKTEDIVPGDLVLLEAGDYIPADMRLLESASLKIEEAALTGESVPVEKTINIIEKTDIVIGDRKNMAYLGSSVAYGRGTGVVTGTGMSTEVGKIAGYLTSHEQEDTPLQKKLHELGKILSVGVIAISIIIFIVGVVRGRSYLDMLLTAISLSVAAIPEGLPAIVTIVLALGVQKMAQNNAIIRKLPAVETLGSTEIICSDKTGTLTLNKMTVQEAYVGGRHANSGDHIGDNMQEKIFLEIMTLCNDSKVKEDDREGLTAIGDPTETALIFFANNKGFNKVEMERHTPRINEIPFDSDRKLMTTIHRIEKKFRVMTKGAPDVLIERCSNVLVNSKIEPMTQNVMNEIQNVNKSMASKALRVLAMAYVDLDSMPEDLSSDGVEKNLIFSGLVGMIDPAREEAKEAVRECKEAGIRAVMITGDHRDTAAAIAKELGIIKDEKEVITGSELDKIGAEDFIKQVSRYSVYARVSPEHKVRIVKAWKANGKIVAMTGDGVNDAPALKTADIGVGMGITGTDVAKGVSDMVLSDDNFATIVVAVKEGRKIYSNIRKAIQFLLSANMGEVITLFVATMLNWNILLPIHILWINLVTDTFPALALGVEKAEKDIMKQKPRKSTAGIMSDGMGANVVYQGFLQALITLASYKIGTMYYNQDIAVTLAFATLGLIQLTHSFNVRSNTKSIFQLGLFTNPHLLGATALSGVLMVSVILIPSLNPIFKVSSLNLEQWAIAIGFALLVIPVVEVIKAIRRTTVKE